MTILDARLHLLDRQLVDADGDPVGIVDDLELDGIEPGAHIAADSRPPRVTGVLSGHVLATRIFGGTTPRSRLQMINWDKIVRVGVTIEIAPTDSLTQLHWVEHWLRDHIIAHIPGGRHAAQ
jgi:sporulation protein YlmC with PRC-barrel domain